MEEVGQKECRNHDVNDRRGTCRCSGMRFSSMHDGDDGDDDDDNDDPMKCD